MFVRPGNMARHACGTGRTRSTPVVRRLIGHGVFPARCAFAALGICDSPDSLIHRYGPAKSDGDIHHIDGDHTRNAPENLAIAHHSCHARHHALTRAPYGADTRRKIGDAHRGVTHSESTREKIAAANRGKKASPETRARMSEAHKARWAKLNGAPPGSTAPSSG